MKRILVALFAAALATSAFAADGAALYAAKCKACHGLHGEGAKMAPKPIAGESVEATKKAILEGKGKMKPVKLTEEDATAVAQHVAELKKGAKKE